MSTPRTEAGKALLTAEFPRTAEERVVITMPGFMWKHHDRMAEAIAAIEDQAAATERARIEGIVEHMASGDGEPVAYFNPAQVFAAVLATIEGESK